MLTTPHLESNAVSLFAKAHKLAEGPQRLIVETRTDSLESDCYVDVQKQIDEHGGEIVYGWQVWEWANILVEGEHHAVWRSPEGDLHDVSLKPDGESEVVFIPDGSKPYLGKRIGKLRLAIWNHQLVKKFLNVCEAIENEYEKGQISETQFNIDPNVLSKLEFQKNQLWKKISSFPRAKQKA